MIFVMPWDYGVYDMLIFVKLADNGLLAKSAERGAIWGSALGKAHGL